MSNTITFPLLGFILSVFFSTAAYVNIWTSSAGTLQLMEPSFMQTWICVSKWWYMPFLIALPSLNLNLLRGRRSLGRMVAGFTTTYAISAYHHWCCEFKSRSRRGLQHYVIKFVGDMRQVGGFLWVPWLLPPIKLTPRYSWNIVESSVKHHKPNHVSVNMWCENVSVICFLSGKNLRYQRQVQSEHEIKEG
jgi:hypothetical protein